MKKLRTILLLILRTQLIFTTTFIIQGCAGVDEDYLAYHPIEWLDHVNIPTGSVVTFPEPQDLGQFGEITEFTTETANHMMTDRYYRRIMRIELDETKW